MTTALIPAPEISIDLTKANRKQIRAMKDAQERAFLMEILRDLINNPAFSLTAAWYVIEQMNNRQMFGYDRKGSDYSAGVLQYGLLAAFAAQAGIFDRVKDLVR